MDLAETEHNILGDLWTSPSLWDNLVYLCDDCNGRFAGTDDERRAGDFLLARLQEYGLANAAAEPFELRGWERGETRLVLNTEAGEVDLPCLALPGSPGCDLEANLLDVKQGSRADYERLGTQAASRIALTSADGPSRGEKYQAAMEAGAAALIFTSGQPGALAPTGSIGKDLPAIGMAYEYAARLQRMLAGKAQRAHLVVKAKVHPATARNIVAEIPGTDAAEGWILAGGHYDGHDVAQGAQDNAAGTAILLEAARLLAPYQADFKAGIRFVFFSGEELGLYGSYAYAREHASQLGQIRLVFNMDVAGLALPLVLQTQASPELAGYLRGLPLRELDLSLNDGPNTFISNSDHFPFSLAGNSAVWAVTSPAPPGGGWVHTQADTLDKLDLRTLRQTTSAVARLLLRMALEPDELPRGLIPPETVKHNVIQAGFEESLRFNGRWPF